MRVSLPGRPLVPDTGELRPSRLIDLVAHWLVGHFPDLDRRSFVRDFAYFLRRSCIDRPCSQRLDRILKIVFTDECFPFVSGQFLNDTVQNPGWRRCMTAAGISELQ